MTAVLTDPRQFLAHDAATDAVCEASSSPLYGCDMAVAVWDPAVIDQLVALVQTPRFRAAQAEGDQHTLVALVTGCMVEHGSAHMTLDDARDVAATIDGRAVDLADEVVR